MNAPNILLFDLGGVLIENAMFENLNRLLPDPTDQIRLKDRWLASPSVRQFERGQSSALTFANGFVTEWNLPISAEAFLEEFSSWPRTFFPGTKQLILELRQRYRVGCLSNSNPLHWAAFENEITSMFDVVLCSHQLGSVKPDQAIFIRALQACNVQPREIYFFDDCLANVHTAHSLYISNGHLQLGYISIGPAQSLLQYAITIECSLIYPL